MSIATPPQITQAFATSGTANTIPVASQIGITPGAASFTDGFPPLTATPIGSGGIPPSVGDMNGILKMLSAHVAYLQSGAGYQYNSGISTAIGGYNVGAMLLAADNSGYWLNLTNNNTTNPDTGGAGWAPIGLQYGIGTVSGLAGSNVTLTATQYGKSVLLLTGALTANINIIFPAIVAEWLIVNSTTGAFAITCKTASGTGFAVAQGGWSTASTINGDGTNIYSNAGSFVTSASLATTLASYVTSAQLATSLSSYVTQTSLTSQLAAYETTAALANTLGSYATQLFVEENFYNTTQIATILTGSYLSIAGAASTYVSTALLSTTLSSYITSAALTARLGSGSVPGQWEVSPNGFLRQWGTGTGSPGAPGNRISFTRPYPTACQSVVACALGQNATVTVLSFDQTGFYLINGVGGSCTWNATGY